MSLQLRAIITVATSAITFIVLNLFFAENSSVLLGANLAIMTITFAILAVWIALPLHHLSKRLPDIIGMADRGTLDESSLQKLGLDKAGEFTEVLGNGLLAISEKVDNGNKCVTNMKNLPTPVIEVDKNFNIVFINDFGASLNDMTAEQCIGKKCYDLMCTSDCNTDNCALRRAMKIGQKEDSETRAQLMGKNANIPISYTGIPTHDAQGNIIGALEFVVDTSNIYNIVEDLRLSANTLGSSSEEMSSQSTQMTTFSNKMGEQARVVAESSTEMSSSVNSVAAAIEEMTASLTEVSSNTQKSSTISSEASDRAEQAKANMTELDEATREIEKVIRIIEDISDQTNLLALNATIEAATAGEAGKGFGVVANEVKELAKQTTLATDEIKQKILEIQEKSATSVTAVHNITEVMKEIAETTSTIAAAVEEQTATTNEIARSVSHASRQSTEVNDNIQGVNMSIEETNSNLINITEASQAVAELGSQLNGVVAQFRL